MGINRINGVGVVVNDDGTLTTGTVGSNEWLQALLDAIDSAFLQTKEVTFTETTGAGVYTGIVSLPAGATVLDVIITQVAQWTATTSATMKVGDVADDDGFFVGMNLKTFGAGASINFYAPFNLHGFYIQNPFTTTAFLYRYSASARDIKGIVTTVGAAGNAGRTRMTVVYSRPATADLLAATKV
jgi:hypothetical protein